MLSAGSGDAVSPRHFVIEKGLTDARGEVDASVQVIMLPICIFVVDRSSTY